MSRPASSGRIQSGIEWVGDIPGGWVVRPLLAVAQPYHRPNVGLKEQNLLSLSFGRIVPKDISINDGLLPASFDTYQIVERGDVVFRFTDLQNDKRSLRNAIVRERGIITSAYLALTPSTCVPEYLNYLMRSYDTTKVFYSMGGGLRQSLKYDDVKRLPVLLPPVAIQGAIADFLDRETAQIDDLIAKQNALIALVGERRKAVITRAITKGHDTQVKMKDSGSAWIGNIPTHWAPARLRDTLVALQGGVSVNGSDIRVNETEQGVLTTGAVSSGVFNVSAHKLVFPEEVGRLACPVKADTVVVNRANAPDLVGSAAYVGNSAPNIFLSDLLWALSFKQGVNPQFVAWWMQTPLYRYQVAVSRVGTSASMQKISQASLRSYVLALPPVAEQAEIVSALKGQTASLDVLVVKSQQVIECLRERRSALITAAVTGKIDVRGEA